MAINEANQQSLEKRLEQGVSLKEFLESAPPEVIAEFDAVKGGSHLMYKKPQDR